MINEIWKDIVGYEGLYQVSNLGRVKSLDRISKNGRFLKGKYKKSTQDKDGYEKVSLSKDGLPNCYLVHRLVAMAFIPNPENKPEVDHINTIRNNNVVENLRWVNKSENNNNPLTKSHRKEFNCGCKKVGCVTTGQVFNSTIEAGEFYNINPSGIRQCCRNVRKSAGKLNDKKLVWKYLN